jgi:hypothetical protein
MSVIYVDTSKSGRETKRLVQSAIEAEINRLMLALDIARQRLVPFEEKYGVTSAQFMAEMTAEDLEGGDDEYVQWAGEYQLMQRLQGKLQQLQGIEYGDSSLLRADKSSH